MSARRSEGVLILVLAGVLAFGCGTSDREIDEHERGDVILSSPYLTLYRFDRRVETVVESPRYWSPPACGYLTERAEAEIDRVLASLDPQRDYEIDVQACEHRWADGVWGSVHIEGFTHGPFHCTPFLGEDCCTDEIAPLGVLYERVLAHLEGDGDDIDEILESVGVETYPMIEPDEPCR